MIKKTEKVPCLRCGETFERRIRSGYFCKKCIEIMDDKAELGRKKERREKRDEILERRGLVDWIPRIDDDRLEEIGLATADGQAALGDAAGPIDGAISEAGPDEGRSTYFSDLAGELDTLCAAAAGAAWWKENKLWHYALHDGAKAAVFMASIRSRCGEQVGTYAGYMRHYRAKEMACFECAEAKRQQSRKERAA